MTISTRRVTKITKKLVKKKGKGGHHSGQRGRNKAFLTFCNLGELLQSRSRSSRNKVAKFTTLF